MPDDDEKISAPIGEEYMLGRCFNRDNYDPNYVGPTWDEVLDLLKFADINTMSFSICGHLDSPKRAIGGSAGYYTTKRAVQHALMEHWNVYGGKLRELSESPSLTPVFVATLLKLETQPRHITGIVIRKES